MNESELIEQIQERRGEVGLRRLSEKQIKGVLELFYDEVIQATTRGESVLLRGFARFKPVLCRPGLKDKTGRLLSTSPHLVVRIKVAARWLESLRSAPFLPRND